MAGTQVGMSSSGLSYSVRNEIKVLAGKRYTDLAAENREWEGLVDLQHIAQLDTTYITDLTTTMARRFTGKHTYGIARVAKNVLTVYPFEAGVMLNREVPLFNLFPNIATCANKVGAAIANFIPRFVFNAFAAGNGITCMDGKNLYDTTHGDGSQDNMGTADFSQNDLRALYKKMIRLKDIDGKTTIGSKPNVLLLSPSSHFDHLDWLSGPVIIASDMAGTASTVRTAMNILGGLGLRIVESEELTEGQFILINTRSEVKPFVVNIPFADAKGLRKFITIDQDSETKDWHINALFDAGYMATDGWYVTAGSVSAGTGWATKMAPTTNPSFL